MVRIARPGELPADQHGQQPADHHEEEAHEQELDADDLVVGREDVLLHETQLFVGVGVSIIVTVDAGDGMRDGGHSSNLEFASLTFQITDFRSGPSWRRRHWAAWWWAG